MGCASGRHNRHRRDGLRGGLADPDNEALAGLCELRRDVPRMGRDERRGRQYYCRTLVRKTARVSPELGDERRQRRRRPAGTPIDYVNLAVRLRCWPRYGGRTDARLSYPGDDAAASAKTPQWA